MTLRTVTPSHRNLQEISLYVPDVPYGPTLNYADSANVKRAVGEAIYEQWMELDRLLAQLWESHSIHLTVLYYGKWGKNGEGPGSCVHSLFPETTGRGIADLVRRSR